MSFLQSKLIAIMLICGSMLFLAGCADYKALPLQRIDYKGKKQGVTMSYRVFNKADCRKYLGRDVLKKGYQPIQITICNNTDESYVISPSSFSLPVAPVELVAQRVHTSTVGRAVGYGAAAWLTCGLLVIPAIVDGIGSAEANEQLDIDFASKTLSLDGVLRPHQVLNGIVFVAKGTFTEDFTFALMNAESKKELTLSSYLA